MPVSQFLKRWDLVVLYLCITTCYPMPANSTNAWKIFRSPYNIDLIPLTEQSVSSCIACQALMSFTACNAFSQSGADTLCIRIWFQLRKCVINGFVFVTGRELEGEKEKCAILAAEKGKTLAMKTQKYTLVPERQYWVSSFWGLRVHPGSWLAYFTSWDVQKDV